MLDNTKERMNLHAWYGSSVRIPAIGTHSFTGFAISSLGIVTSIVREAIGKNIRVRFMKGGTAHADWDNYVIAINENYLRGNVRGDDYPTLESDEALTNIMGIEVHEAAHFAYSPRTLLPFVDHIKRYTKSAYQEDIAVTLSNIIEDIYVEAEVDREIPSLTWMLDCMNDIFFSQYDEKDTILKAQHVTAAPSSLMEVSLALNAIIFAKTRVSVATTPFLANLFALARSATEMQFLQERIALSLKIYDVLMEKITQEECYNPDGTEEEGDAGGSKDKKSGEVQRALSESKRMAEGVTASHEGGDVPKAVDPVSGSSSRIESSLEKIADMKISMDLTEGDEDSTFIFLEKELPLADPLSITDTRYYALTEIARQRSSVNRPYGLDKARGHSMRKLYRIATDSKIFAEPVSMSTYQPMEVILLIDFSGSMTHEGSQRGVSRIEEAFFAALGAAQALVEARCSVAVYAHTADIYTENEVVIHKCKGFNESITTLSPRLGYALMSDGKCENRDGYAIRYVAAKFSRGLRKKLLIVISDGEPAANNYCGYKAEQHAKTEVEKVRERGIDVLSISITAEAARANNFIYGREKNVYNRSPHVISEIVRSLIVG
jgi:nitric oxide reductase activation protein